MTDPMPAVRSILGMPPERTLAPAPIEELIEAAEQSHEPKRALVYAQIATVRAIQAQTEQARIANLLTASQLIEPTGDSLNAALDAIDEAFLALGLVWR